MLQNERSKAPIFYLLFESVVIVALFFYVPQVQQTYKLDTIAFFIMAIISTALYLFASCKDPGFVNPLPLTMEEQQGIVQSQDNRTQSSGKNENACRQTTNLFIEETNEKKRQFSSEKFDQKAEIQSKVQGKEMIFNSTSLKNKGTNRKVKVITENQLQEQSKDKQSSKNIICKSESDQVNNISQCQEINRYYKTYNNEQNHPQGYAFYDDMDPNCQYIQESQYNINELESVIDPGSSNTPKSFAFDNGISMSTRQDSPIVLKDIRNQNKSLRYERIQNDKLNKQQGNSIDETQLLSERTVGSPGIRGISSLANSQNGLEKEQNSNSEFQRIQAVLNTDVSLLKEVNKDHQVVENNQKKPIKLKDMQKNENTLQR